MKDFSSWFTVAIFVDFKPQVRYTDTRPLSSWTPLTQTLHFTPVTHSYSQSPDYVITSICIFSQTSVLIIPHLLSPELIYSTIQQENWDLSHPTSKQWILPTSEVERGSQGIQRICSSGWHLTSSLVRLSREPSHAGPDPQNCEMIRLGVLRLC